MFLGHDAVAYYLGLMYCSRVTDAKVAAVCQDDTSQKQKSATAWDPRVMTLMAQALGSPHEETAVRSWRMTRTM